MTSKKKQILEHPVDSLKKYSKILNESKIFEGTADAVNPENFYSWEEYQKSLDNISVEEIAKVMNSGILPIFPSNWSPTELWGQDIPYPGKLASALIHSKNSESLTDLANLYYSRHRKYSDEAINIFKIDAVRTGDKFLLEWGISGSIVDLLNHAPDLVAKILLTMDDEELARVATATTDYVDGKTALAIAKVLEKFGVILPIE